MGGGRAGVGRRSRGEIRGSGEVSWPPTTLGRDIEVLGRGLARFLGGRGRRCHQVPLSFPSF